MKTDKVQLYMAIWIFWSEKEKQYYYTEPIITPYLNYDWLSKDRLHLSRAINSFGKNMLSTTNHFHCFDGNKINEKENCVRGIIYVKHTGESNLNEKEYKQGFTDSPPVAIPVPAEKENYPFKSDLEIEEIKAAGSVGIDQGQEERDDSNNDTEPVQDDWYYDLSRNRLPPNPNAIVTKQPTIPHAPANNTSTFDWEKEF